MHPHPRNGVSVHHCGPSGTERREFFFSFFCFIRRVLLHPKSTWLQARSEGRCWKKRYSNLIRRWASSCLPEQEKRHLEAGMAFQVSTPAS